MAINVSEGEVQPKNFSNFLGLPSKNATGPLGLHTISTDTLSEKNVEFMWTVSTYTEISVFHDFPHRIEVDNFPHYFMWLVLIVLMWFLHT